MKILVLEANNISIHDQIRNEECITNSARQKKIAGAGKKCIRLLSSGGQRDRGQVTGKGYSDMMDMMDDAGLVRVQNQV